jgi:hypothetical protein
MLFDGSVDAKEKEKSMATHEQLDTLCINTIRTLSIDAVQQANSGHPSTPMGMGKRKGSPRAW